ncbi:MAG: thiamine pyrophosphate-dependent enzyme [Desulfobacterales bacterium]
MIRIRRLEEKCAELYSTMKIRGFMHLYDGEEAVAVAIFMGGGPAMVYGCEALAALDQFEAAGVAGNIGTP